MTSWRHYDSEFLDNEALRSAVMKESGGLKQQVTLLKMHEYRQAHGIPNGVGRRPRVQKDRIDFLRELIQCTLLTQNLIYNRNIGGRVSSGAIPIPATITEFRYVFVYAMERVRDPAIHIRTSADGTCCHVYISCQKVLCEVLDLTS